MKIMKLKFEYASARIHTEDFGLFSALVSELFFRVQNEVFIYLAITERFDYK